MVKSGSHVGAKRLANATSALLGHRATAASDTCFFPNMQAQVPLTGICRKDTCPQKNHTFTGKCQCGWAPSEIHRIEKTQRLAAKQQKQAASGIEEQWNGYYWHKGGVQCAPPGPHSLPAQPVQQPAKGGGNKGSKNKAQANKDNITIQQLQKQQQLFVSHKRHIKINSLPCISSR